MKILLRLFPLILGILLALASASRHAVAQERQGTISVVRYDPTRVIVAADSRHNFGKGVSASPNDLACKVTALGKHVVFVAAGLVGYDNKGPRDRLHTWRAEDEARHVYANLMKQGGIWEDNRLVELSASWGDVVRSHIADFARFSPLAVRNSAVAGLLTTALIATARGKNAHVALVQIAFDANDRVYVITPRRIRLGKGQIVTEFLELRSERAKIEAGRFAREVHGLSEDEREVRRVIRLVDLTIRLHPDRNDVGGPVDALELRGGEPVRWIQRKPECPG